MKAAPVQGEGTQPGDAVSLMAQLPVQPLSVQPGAPVVRVVGADNVHTSGCSMFLSPGGGRTWGWGMGDVEGVLLGVERGKWKGAG